MPAPHPRMHGLTHVPGGPDPIPGLVVREGTYQDQVLAHPCLEHYWRGSGTDLRGLWHLDLIVDDDVGPTHDSYPVIVAGGFTNKGAQGVAGDFGRVERPDPTGVAPPYWSGTAPFTIELWATLDAPPPPDTEWPLPQRLLTIGSNAITIDVSSGDLILTCGGATLTHAFPTDSSTYIAARYTGTVLELRFDGALVDSAAMGVGSGATDSLSWLNMRSGSTSWAPWNGSSSDLAIYSCAITDQEMINHFQLQGHGGITWRHGPGAPPDGTVSDYWLDTVSGDVWFNTAGTWNRIFNHP